ncbi:MFS transporter [Microbulbifer sp. JMSA002]|uniref:MFS transporter n=1 Tax=Microbulbifer sp. JMSA002 TaxID=3243368 RepID=UPI004039652A
MESVKSFKKAQNINLLLLILVANGVAHSLFVITFPLLGRNLGLTDIQTGFILTISSLAMMISAPFWGVKSEIYGRKKIISIGILITGIFLILTASTIYIKQTFNITVASVFLIILCLRLCQAIGVGGIMPAAQAFIADLTSRDYRARGMGKMGAAFGVGTIVGGFIAMLIGKHSIAIGFSIVGLSLIILWWLGCNNLQESKEIGSSSLNTKFGLSYKNLLPMLFITFCGLLIYGTLQQVIGLRLQDEFGYSSGEALKRTGAVMMTSMTVMVITQGALMKLLSWSPEKLLIGGCIIQVVALVISASADSYLWLFLGMAILGGGMGLLFPGNLALLSLSGDENTQGKIAGINGVSKGLGLALGPLMGAFLHQFSPLSPFMFTILLGGLMVAVSFWRVKNHKLILLKGNQSI